MSCSSVFFHTVISPVSHTYKGLGRLCCMLYLDKVAETAFRFFHSYGNSPKDLAKALQVLSCWTVIICDKKGSPNELAQKVSSFAKQAKCFISLAGLPAQFSRTTGMYLEPSAKNVPARSLEKILGDCAGLYNSVFDSVSLLNALGFVSSKTKVYEVLQFGNGLSTTLGSLQRLKGDTGQLRKKEVALREQVQNIVKLIGNLAILALGALPFSSGFKNCSAHVQNSIMLRLSTIVVITNLLDKHIPATFPSIYGYKKS